MFPLTTYRCQLLKSSSVLKIIMFVSECVYVWAFQMAPVVKNPPANVEDIRDAGSFPGSGKFPEECMKTHSSILSWRIPWAEEPGRPQSMGSQRDRYDWETEHVCMRVCVFCSHSNRCIVVSDWASLVAQTVKNPPAVWDTWVIGVS